MAYNVSGTGQFIEGATPITAAPFTISCLARHGVNNVSDTVVSITQKASSTERWQLQFRDQAGPPVDPCRFLALDSPTLSQANTTTGKTISTWHHLCGSIDSVGGLAAYIDGGSKGTGSFSATPDATDTLTIGAVNDASPAELLTGDMAEVAMWNRQLTDDEVALLGLRFSPLFVRRGLIFYAPLIRGAVDIVGGLALTVTGATVTDHPRVIYPKGMWAPFIAAAGGGGGQAARSMHQYRQRRLYKPEVQRRPSGLYAVTGGYDLREMKRKVG